jgi:hypothetical protein
MEKSCRIGPTSFAEQAGKYTLISRDMLQSEAVYCSKRRDGRDVTSITSAATIHSSHASLISTLGTYLSRIMIDSLMMAF